MDRPPNINQLIEAVAAGRIPASAAGLELRTYYPSTGADVPSYRYRDVERRLATGEMDEFQPGGLDEIEKAYIQGRLSEEDYRAIYEALTARELPPGEGSDV